MSAYDNIALWDNKRYHSLDYELKKIYGHKVYKLSLNGGMTCPNRDGSLGDRGCIFCSQGGSGDFAAAADLTISEQIAYAKSLVETKTKNAAKTEYIAYFQAYTNTYAPLSYLRCIFTEAISHPEILILSIATRPDCLDDEVIELLAELNRIKPVWIELGLQTIHEESASFIRRGYSLKVFEDRLYRLRSNNIAVIVHTILGLPNETKHDMLMTMQYLAEHPIHGIKLQLLHILQDTDLGRMYEQGLVSSLDLDSYIDILISCLELLPPDIVIHRITGDGPKSKLLAPLWSSNKKAVLNRIYKEMIIRDSYQGKYAGITRPATQ